LAVVNAYLGAKQPALEYGERGMSLLPASKDAVLGPTAEQTLARVEAEVGEKQRAIARLQHLLNVSYAAYEGPPITRAFLKLHPFWDPIRGDPGFEALVQKVVGEKK
jgi:hypothetical protein